MRCYYSSSSTIHELPPTLSSPAESFLPGPRGDRDRLRGRRLTGSPLKSPRSDRRSSQRRSRLHSSFERSRSLSLLRPRPRSRVDLPSNGLRFLASERSSSSESCLRLLRCSPASLDLCPERPSRRSCLSKRFCALSSFRCLSLEVTRGLLLTPSPGGVCPSLRDHRCA